jgi:hypothetical protein
MLGAFGVQVLILIRQFSNTFATEERKFVSQFHWADRWICLFRCRSQLYGDRTSGGCAEAAEKTGFGLDYQDFVSGISLLAASPHS